MAEQRRRLGEILIEAGVLTEQQLSKALEIQKDDGRRLGAILMSYGFVAEPQLVQALSRQLSVPWVSLWHVDVPDELLELVPFEVAEACCAVPVYVRSDRDTGTSLYVAMDDPTNEEALQRVAQSAMMPVKAMVAGPSDIASAIKEFYEIPEPASTASEDVERPEAVTIELGKDELVSIPSIGSEPSDVEPSDEDDTSASAKDDTSAPAEDGGGAHASQASDTHDEQVDNVVTLDESQVVEGDAEVAVEAEVAEPAPSEETSDSEPSASDTIDERLEVLEAAASSSGEMRPGSDEKERSELSEEADHGSDVQRPGGSGATIVELDADVAELERAGGSYDEVIDSKGLVEERDLEEDDTISLRARRTRALALTLLDGTTIELKGSTHKEEEKIGSVPELVALLRASAKGSPLPKSLPSRHWEDYIANLIELLVSKRLLTEDEILERLLR